MMANIDLKNLNIEDLKEQILKFADKKTLIKIGIGFGGLIIFLIIYYAVINPIVEKKKVQIEDMNIKKQETQKNLSDIKSMKAKIKKLRPRYEKYSSLFHSKAEVEGLYQSLSEFATLNDLVITKIEKKKIKPVLKADALAAAAGKKKKKGGKKNKAKKMANVAYYLIPVQFEIDGSFIGYIKFKRAVSLSNKMLNFDKETISVVKSKDSTGAIKAKGTLTIVGLPNEFF
tara:strand:+ start:101 stop:790 length:690 start_codon:yes stop_codon:yes gene_type:complete